MKYLILYIRLKLENNSCVFTSESVDCNSLYFSYVYQLIPVFVVKSVHYIPYNIHVVYMACMQIQIEIAPCYSYVQCTPSLPVCWC